MLQNVFLDAGTYQLAFLAAQRAINQSHYEEIEVAVDGVPEGVVNPVNNLFGYYQSSTFTVSTGPAYDRVPGLESPGRHQHGLYRSGGALGQRHERRQLRDAGLDHRRLPVAPPIPDPGSFSATTGLARNGSSFTSGNPNAPDGQPGGLHPGQRHASANRST